MGNEKIGKTRNGGKRKIMSWNYRILRHTKGKNTWYAVHEVFYKKDKPVSCTVDPIDITSEEIKGIKWVLKHMAKATKRPILDYSYFENMGI